MFTGENSEKELIITVIFKGLGANTERAVLSFVSY